MDSLAQYLKTEWPESEPPLVAVWFRRNRGDSYPYAVETAKTAALSRELGDGRLLHHLAVFARSQQQAGAAAALLQLLANIKGTQVFDGQGRRLPDNYTAQTVLECYAKSTWANDCRAYCQRIVTDTYMGKPFNLFGPESRQDRYLVPCRLLNIRRLLASPEHPASPRDLVQAAAVQAGCHWCPHFDAGAFRKVGDVNAADVERLLDGMDLEL